MRCVRTHFLLLICLSLGMLCSAPLPAQEANEVESPETSQEPTSAEIGYFEALILGVVEGITEYLPISSTGHLILTNDLLGLNVEDQLLDHSGMPLYDEDGEPYTLKNAADAYAIVIQGGAILAVLLLYWQRLWNVGMGVLTGFLAFAKSGKNGWNGLTKERRAGALLGRNLLLAFLPAVVLGLLFDDFIESVLFGVWPVVVALVAGSFLMLWVEKWRRKKLHTEHPEEVEKDLGDLTMKESVFIGLLQCVAMWPGTSRSMMTIVGGYLVGLKPVRAAEFSFLLGLITLSAASAYKLLSDGQTMLKALDIGPLIFGVVVATISAALAVKWLVSYLTKHGLTIFAWYRLALAAAVTVWLFWGA